MKTTVIKANERGHAHHGWLNSYYSFSFGDYKNPDRMNFGALRFINDNIIAIGNGYMAENAQNMIIINIPLKDALHFKDSFGVEGMVRWGQMLIINTGRATSKCEYNNHSELHQVEFLQIGVSPKIKDMAPNQKIVTFLNALQENNFEYIIAPDGTAPATVSQDLCLSLGEFHHGITATYKQKIANTGLYLFVLGGAVTVAGQNLETKDAIILTDKEQVQCSFTKNTALLILEVPL